jgi:probable HAF family extracellular repeat protein
MRRSRFSHLGLVAALAGTASASAAAAAAVRARAATTSYTITDLGSLGGGVTHATAINASGEVTGHSTLTEGGDVYHAFLWSNGKMTDLGTLGGPDSNGRAINDSGEVVGMAEDSGEIPHGALWTGNKATARAVGGTVANGINDSGQIVNGITGVTVGPVGARTALPIPPGFIICEAAGSTTTARSSATAR